MILRIRTKNGTFRVTVGETDQFAAVLEQIAAKAGVTDFGRISVSDKPNEAGKNGNELAGQTIGQLALKNGDMLFASVEEDAVPAAAPAVATSGSVAVPIVAAGPKLLPVDETLDKQQGLIPRGRSSFCRHGDKGMCEYCSPLPPWDKEYLEKNGIKHKSFFSHVKELNESKNNKNNATSYMHPLEEPDFGVKRNCPAGHLPWPKGICSKCQPPVITLQQQKFRMVDHVEFADSDILNKFIDCWRGSGMQRYGVMYGTYEPYDKVPLGVRALVQAIYEPPQADEFDGVTLLPWDDEAAVDAVAQSLGLYKVGVIFTDLTDAGMKNGTVLCKRHKESYFLSCLEVLMAARNQIRHPSATKYTGTGTFSSKFVTCVISGGLKGEIEPRSYQVSADAEALVRADIAGGSTKPSEVYINTTSDKRYVPDIFYSKINEYGLEVKTIAKPTLPVDYLLVALSDSFPLDPQPMFKTQFVVENRDFLGELQNLGALYRHLSADTAGAALSDFHLVNYIARTNILGPAELAALAQFARTKDQAHYVELVESGGWMTLLTILEQSA